MLVYVWSRRNPHIRMNVFGLLNFQAPFLPWVLMGFSLLLGNSVVVDLLGRSKVICGYKSYSRPLLTKLAIKQASCVLIYLVVSDMN